MAENSHSQDKSDKNPSDSRKSVQWYFQVAGSEVGPVTARQLREMARSGKLLPDDLVRNDNSDNWSKARAVRGLFTQAESNQKETKSTHHDPSESQPVPSDRDIGPKQEDSYYYKRDGKTFGPYTWERMLYWVKTGYITATTPVQGPDGNWQNRREAGLLVTPESTGWSDSEVELALKIGACFIVGVLCIWIVSCTASCVSNNSSSHSPSRSSDLPAQRSIEDRINNPRTEAERRSAINEYMLRDARDAVREGQMTEQEFENFTGVDY